METKETEKAAGWIRTGDIFTYLVKGTGRVSLDSSKLSKELREFCFSYGLGRLLPDRTSALKGAEKLNAMAKLARLAESGVTTLTLRETAEERAARERAELEADLIEALTRLGYGAETMIAGLMAQKHWQRETAVGTLAAQKAVAAEIVRIQQERRFERAKPGPEIDLDDLMAQFAE